MTGSINWIWILLEIVFFSVHQVLTNVTWAAETKIIRIGETVVLTCTVHDVEMIDSGVTRQWFKGSSPVCYNGQPTNPLKYNEFLDKNQFKLMIFYVSEDDLNCEYQCQYSFETFAKKLEITTKNFEHPPTVNMTELKYNYSSNGNLNVKLIMQKVFPLPNCTVLLELIENDYIKEINQRLRTDLQYMFTHRTHKKNGLYFEVHLVHQSKQILKANTALNVTCQLLEQYVVAAKEIKIYKGDNHVLDQDESSTLPDKEESATTPDSDKFWKLPIIISMSVFAIIVLGGIAVYCFVQRKRRKNIKDESMRTVEMQQLAKETDKQKTESKEPMLDHIDKEL